MSLDIYSYMPILLLSSSRRGAVREPSRAGAEDAGPEIGGDGGRHNQGPPTLPGLPVPATPPSVDQGGLQMKDAEASVSRVWARAEIRGAGGVTNRLFQLILR